MNFLESTLSEKEFIIWVFFQKVTLYIIKEPNLAQYT